MVVQTAERKVASMVDMKVDLWVLRSAENWVASKAMMMVEMSVAWKDVM